MRWPWQRKPIVEFSNQEIANEFHKREEQIREDAKRESMIKFANDMISAVNRDAYSVDIEVCHKQSTPTTSAFLVTFVMRRQEI